MKYDFTTVIDRSNAGSYKWNAMYRIDPQVEKGVVPLSVADMEFVNAPEIVSGLQDYIGRTVLGYTGPTDAYCEAVIDWMRRRHGFAPKPEWLVTTPGVVPAVDALVRCFTEPADKVLVLTPVYYPFFSAATDNGRGLVPCDLVPDGRTYAVDFDEFAKKAADPAVTLCILSSPHNPVGKVFTRAELEQLCAICLENGVYVVCDEIHHDLILPGFAHVSAGTLPEPLLSNAAICTAPSKTFNLAGLQTSNIFLPDPARRERFADGEGDMGVNMLGLEACRLAYTKGEPWLEALLGVIDRNKRLVEREIARHLPQVTVYELQGTYLQWLDFRPFGMDCDALEAFMTQKARLFLDEGYLFGEAGKGFERINLACPTTLLQSALDRLFAAASDL